MNEVGIPRLRLVQVGHPAYSRVHCPFPSTERKIVGEDFGRTKVALPVVERDESRAFPKPDDVRTSISRQVDYKPWVLRNHPPLLDPEIVEGEFGWVESPITFVECDVNTGVTKPNDIATLIAREVGNESRVLVNLPSLCSSKVLDDQFDWPKSAAAVIQRRQASGTSATNDVCPSVSGQIGHEAGVNANLPSSSTDAEVVDDGFRSSKSPISVVAPDKDMFFPKTNDIETSVSCDVGEETKMTVEAPTTSFVAEVVQSEGAAAEV